ncbi:hypothetical protein ACIPL1_18800 [Pseudomonas sp. NPDC090202]|uniref:hypothetical protein n=1 Tax=unclassified Pseudomonas TaxID=196821 RepID=UPI0037FF494C
MQASDVGLLMLVVIAVLGTLISLFDHRAQLGATAPDPVIEKPPRSSEMPLAERESN